MHQNTLAQSQVKAVCGHSGLIKPQRLLIVQLLLTLPILQFQSLNNQYLSARNLLFMLTQSHKFKTSVATPSLILVLPL
ncbi:MAG TPA: hypothetical protein DF774_12645 [Rheinheimera sp.]|nr:hypothetical protein [Rheinheimera sp.]